MDDFDARNRRMIEAQGGDPELKELSRAWLRHSSRYEYSYHFTWLGRPIIQFPHDVLAMQEIVWKVKPDLIVETGIARGGSLILYASLLELIGGDRTVLGIDIDIREHNRREIERHPLAKRITMMQGSSIDPALVAQVKERAKGKRNVLVVLDSNHTHAHVLSELRLYSPLVGRGGYLCVFDTIIEDMPTDFTRDRPWSKGNNPKTAVWEFLKENDRFAIDREIQDKLLVTVAPDGYLKCLKD
jgi:cephalosporin hydroxylase